MYFRVTLVSGFRRSVRIAGSHQHRYLILSNTRYESHLNALDVGQLEITTNVPVPRRTLPFFCYILSLQYGTLSKHLAQ